MYNKFGEFLFLYVGHMLKSFLPFKGNDNPVFYDKLCDLAYPRKYSKAERTD